MGRAQAARHDDRALPAGAGRADRGRRRRTRRRVPHARLPALRRRRRPGPLAARRPPARRAPGDHQRHRCTPPPRRPTPRPWRRCFARTRTLASAEGGPYRWEPLLYLAYARHDPAISEDAAVRSARLLLDHGADPNAGYLWHGLIPAVHRADRGARQRRGRPAAAPAGLRAGQALLLDAGADPNDGQALYNRQFGSDDSHLALLLSHGLGQGGGGPWRARFGPRTDSPAELIRGQLRWAVTHDMRDRVRLLAEHGADLPTPFEAARRGSSAASTPATAGPRPRWRPSAAAGPCWTC